MEYFLGSLVTLITIFTMVKLFKNSNALKTPVSFLQYSQSYSFDLVKHFLPTNEELSRLDKKPSQSQKHDKKTQVRVLITGDKAYWIRDNAFYSADVEDGEIVKDSTSKVDTMGMDSVQLEEMAFIVDQLTEGFRDDSGNAGKQKF
jgi:hypothetical protein